MYKENDNSKTKIVNKGADVAVIADSATVNEAMKASRILAVKGFSTAVIEVLTIDPLDEETILNFGEKTGAVVFTEQYLYEAAARIFINHKSVILGTAENSTTKNIIDTSLSIVRSKLHSIN